MSGMSHRTFLVRTPIEVSYPLTRLLTYNVTTKFTPILRAYVALDYRENQVVRTPFSQSAIWEQDLDGLPPDTDWMLHYDKATGQWSITWVGY
jgi:hypothetical protein